MDNAYMIDIILILIAAISIVLAVRGIKNRLIAIKANDIGVQALGFVFSNTFKAAIIVAAPTLAAYAFILWRSTELMHYFRMWGYGGAGLTVMLALAGTIVISLFSLLLAATNSKYLALDKPEKDSNQDDNRK